MGNLRSEITKAEILKLYEEPVNDLLFKAHQIHRENFNANEVQVSTLCSVKTGACPEDCHYCPQSAHHNADLKPEPFMEVSKVVEQAQAAKNAGASRFCMGAAWRKLHDRDLDKVCDMVLQVKDLGLETCVTLGMLEEAQVKKLEKAGLDYYNHNVDSSEEFYKKIITTRKYQDRLDTLENLANSNINICSGGIIGMGETREDRAGMLLTLLSLKKSPKSIPINLLEKVDGTPLAGEEDLDVMEFIRTIAITRILFPESYVRLSAGRQNLSKEAQSMCFFAGANSIFYGEKLLTQKNPEQNEDKQLFSELGIRAI
jgi:biotin synthase